jgi:serine/threonine protein phosphatase PrpC
VPGYDHISAGRECQDAWRADQAADVALLAVADGAGSEERSAEGAAIAAGSAIAEARRRLRVETPRKAQGWTDLLRGVATVAAARVIATAETLGVAPGKLATTLTLCFLVDDWCACLRVGDGFVAVRSGTRKDEHVGYHLLLPRPPAVAGQQDPATKFLTSPSLPELLERAPGRYDSHAATTVLRDRSLTAALVSSDGLEDVAIERKDGAEVGFAGFLAPIFNAVEDNAADALVQLLIDGVASAGGDDKTALIAVRVTGPEESSRRLRG